MTEFKELLDLLQRTGNEGENIEAKRAENDLPRSARETLSSFSNTRGGILILGLDEESGFQVTGTGNPAKISADLVSMCSSEMEPPVRAEVDVIEIDGKSVVVAEITEIERRHKPCYVKSVGINRGSYARIGDADRRLTT